MINRDYYLSKLVDSKENGFPKVITGIRRCGKSYLLKEIYRNYLLDNYPGCNIISVDLDETENAKYRNPIELDNYIQSTCDKKKMNFVFIDEIQLVDPIINPIYTEGKYVLAKHSDKNAITFVDTVLGLSHKKYIDLYVTGSNSKMLSSDIVTEFRDKATNIQVYPLSFEEFYKFYEKSETDAVYEYMQYGGMPLAVLKKGNDKKEYLKNLFKTTYFKDIIEHNNLQKNEALDELCNIISENCGQLFNSTKIANAYKSIRKEDIDTVTVNKYISYFTDSFLIRETTRYDVKGLREIGALRKYYFSDNGLRNARINFAYDDEGQMLENMIYNELIYNDYSVNVGAFEKVEKNKNGKSIKKNYEIDFVAKKGNRRYYIQVASDVSDKNTKTREMKPFIALKDQVQKILVINKPIKESIDSDGYITIGVADFLLRFIK